MADLTIIGSGGVVVGGRGVVSRWLLGTIIGSGGVVVNGTGTVEFTQPGITIITGSGGVVVSGAGTVAFTTPTVLTITGSGGVVVGGTGTVETAFLPVTTITGEGGVEVGGVSGTISALMPAHPPIATVIEGSGGIKVGGQGVLSVVAPTALQIIGSGGIKVGGFWLPDQYVTFTYPIAPLVIIGSGGVEVGGEGIVKWSATPPVYVVPGPQEGAPANILMGGKGMVVFILPQVLEVIGAGEIAVGVPMAGIGPVETYVLTGSRGEPSMYSGFEFNSYAQYREQYYGATDDGIYLLEGEDDDGHEIHSGLRIGPINFGTQKQKRLRLLHIGGKTDAAQVKISNESGDAGYADSLGGYVPLTRDMQGREITLDIAGFDSMDHLEVVPHVLMGR